MPNVKTAPFKIEEVNSSVGHVTVRYINIYGPIESGEVTLEDLAQVVEIPTGDFNLDGTPITRQETIYPDNPNEDLIYNVDAPIVDGQFVTGDALLEHIARSYPFDIFEDMKARKNTPTNPALDALSGKAYQINLVYPDPESVPLTLEEAKVQRVAYVEQSRIQAMTELTVLWNGFNWNASEEILTRISNVILTLEDAAKRGYVVPTSIPWLTFEDIPIALSLDDLSALRIAILEQQNTLWGKNTILKQQIQAAQTIDEVAGITW